MSVVLDLVRSYTRGSTPSHSCTSRATAFCSASIPWQVRHVNTDGLYRECLLVAPVRAVQTTPWLEEQGQLEPVSNAGHSSGISRQEPRLLTQMIKRQSSTVGLAKLWEQYWEVMNVIHITALLVCLASVSETSLSDNCAATRLAAQVLPRLLLIIQQFDCRGVANILHSLAKLRMSDHQTIEALVQHSRWLLPAFLPQHLSVTLWSLAVLKHQPPRSWVKDYLVHVHRQLPHCSPQSLSNTIWALARLRVFPDPPWIKGFLAAAQGKLSDFKTEELTSMLYALSVLGIRPDEVWLKEVLGGFREHMGVCGSEELSAMLLACARLRVRPSKVWLLQYFLTSRQLLGTFQSRQLVMVAFGLARMKCRPGQLWSNTFEHSVLSQLSSMDNRELTTLLWSLGRMSWFPHPRLMKRVEQLLAEQMSLCSGVDVVLAALGLAWLRYSPSTSWWQQYLEVSVKWLPSLRPSLLAHIFWALSTLNVSPSGDWLSTYSYAALECIDSFDISSLRQIRLQWRGLQRGRWPSGGL